MQPVKDFVINKLAGPLIAVGLLFAAIRYVPQATTTAPTPPNLPTVDVIQVPPPPAKIARSFVTKNDAPIPADLESKLSSIVESGTAGEYLWTGFPEDNSKLRRKRILIEDLDAPPVVVKPLPTTPDPIKPLPVTPGTQVTYVFEKDETAISSGVFSGLSRLSKEKKVAVASTFEKDSKDGNGEIPEMFKVPLEAALKEGLPALVASNGPTVLKVIKAPKTEAEVLAIAP